MLVQFKLLQLVLDLGTLGSNVLPLCSVGHDVFSLILFDVKSLCGARFSVVCPFYAILQMESFDS